LEFCNGGKAQKYVIPSQTVKKFEDMCICLDRVPERDRHTEMVYQYRALHGSAC